MEDNIFDKIHEVDLKETMETSYIDYAMSVIASRALQFFVIHQLFSPTEKEARFTAASFSILLHLQEFQDLFQRMKSCDSPEYLLTVHNQHGGYLHDLKLFCQLWFFVHIDFAEFHIAGFLRCLF